MAFYAGPRGTQLDAGPRRAPGALIPEAATWRPDLRTELIRAGEIVEREPFTAAELIEHVDTSGLKELCAQRQIEPGEKSRGELIAALLASSPPELLPAPAQLRPPVTRPDRPVEHHDPHPRGGKPGRKGATAA